jgi:hypothetical protein
MPRLQASTEIFFRNAKFFKGGDGDGAVEAPPVFIIDGVSYLHVKVRPGCLMSIKCSKGLVAAEQGGGRAHLLGASAPGDVMLEGADDRCGRGLRSRLRFAGCIWAGI